MASRAIFGLAALAAVGLAATVAGAAAQSVSSVARGKYLVTVMSCGDCHTRGSLTGAPDTAHPLAGSDVGFAIPGLGVFVGRNLTSDKETGLGSWNKVQIIKALTKGERPDGRVLAPIMPWRAFGNLSSTDAGAIADYLKSLKPVKNRVPGPFGPSETPTTLVMTVLPGPAFAKLPKPPSPKP